MFILITYDVNITSQNGAKRLRNVAKVCQNYGKRVQNSVFECVLTESQYIMIKSQLGLTKLFLPNILVLGLKHPQGCQCHRKFSF